MHRIPAQRPAARPTAAAPAASTPAAPNAPARPTPTPQAPATRPSLEQRANARNGAAAQESMRRASLAGRTAAPQRQAPTTPAPPAPATPSPRPAGQLGQNVQPQPNPSVQPTVPPQPPAQPAVGRTYVLFRVTGNHNSEDDNMFSAAAETRRRDIQNSPDFRPGVDRVEVVPIRDISDVQGQMARITAENNAAGRDTAEVDVYSHAGFDGPVGSVVTTRDQLPEANSAQMTLNGWSRVDFDWARSGAHLNFMGCNTGNTNATHSQSFAAAVSGLPNVHNVSVGGQVSSSYPSQYTDVRDTTLGREVAGYDDSDRVYMVSGNPSDGQSALFFGAEARPLSINRDGREVTRENQPGVRHDADTGPHYRSPLRPPLRDDGEPEPLPPMPLLIL